MCIRALGLILFMLFRKNDKHEGEDGHQHEIPMSAPKGPGFEGGVKSPQTTVMGDGPPQYDAVVAEGWPLRSPR